MNSLPKNVDNGVATVEIYFIGVGEACDSSHGNSSSLVTTENGARILLDCGFSVPHNYFRSVPDPTRLDYIWISHFHGDHFFGLPLLFLRLWLMNRTAPLPIVSQEGVADKVRSVMELAFPGFEEKLSFKLEFHIVNPLETTSLGGLQWTPVITHHTQKNYGLLLDDQGKRFYYSGDGRATPEVKKLIQGCDFVIHEAFNHVDRYPYHGSITSALQLADDAEVGQIALVHLERVFRETEIDLINKMVAARPKTFLPVAGDRFEI